jgi:hypothetical protein
MVLQQSGERRAGDHRHAFDEGDQQHHEGGCGERPRLSSEKHGLPCSSSVRRRRYSMPSDGQRQANAGQWPRLAGELFSALAPGASLTTHQIC